LYRLELALRRHLPAGLKNVLRLARLAIQPVPPPAPSIPQAQLEACQLLCSRYEMLRRLPQGGDVAEIGTFRGDFARTILDIMAPARLHLADITFSLCRADVLADPRVEKHEGTSLAFLNSRADASLDHPAGDTSVTLECGDDGNGRFDERRMGARPAPGRRHLRQSPSCRSDVRGACGRSW
jgi:hypothetical protein